MKRQIFFQRNIVKTIKNLLASLKDLLKNQLAGKAVTCVEASPGSIHVYSRVLKSLTPGVVWGHHGALLIFYLGIY